MSPPHRKSICMKCTSGQAFVPMVQLPLLSQAETLAPQSPFIAVGWNLAEPRRASLKLRLAVLSLLADSRFQGSSRSCQSSPPSPTAVAVVAVDPDLRPRRHILPPPGKLLVLANHPALAFASGLVRPGSLHQCPPPLGVVSGEAPVTNKWRRRHQTARPALPGRTRAAACPRMGSCAIAVLCSIWPR
jgi:hypothetical protein